MIRQYFEYRPKTFAKILPIFRSYPSRLILLVRSSQRFFVSTKMMVLFSFSAMISSISWISLMVRKERISNASLRFRGGFLWNKLFSYFSSFSVSMQTSTIWRMLWLALSSRAPMLIWIYSFRKSSASCRTSFGQVALHIRVCLSGWVGKKKNRPLEDFYIIFSILSWNKQL